jgi:hypothetical protein
VRSMIPAKIKEHEPTAVKREMSEKIIEPRQTGTNSQYAAEIARKKRYGSRHYRCGTNWERNRRSTPKVDKWNNERILSL